MHFVNADGSAQPVLLGPALNPLLVGPRELPIVPDNRGVLRGGLEEETIRISLKHERAVDVFDFVLVKCAFAEVWNEDFPDARSAEGAHRVIASVPVIEGADDADALGVGRPNRKA